MARVGARLSGGIVAAFVLFAVSFAIPPPASAATGRLTVDVAPARATPGNGHVAVRVTNTGDAAVEGVAVSATAPPGVTAAVEPATATALPPGASLLASLTVTGAPPSRPASVVVTAAGRTGATGTAAMATVDLVAAEPAVSLTLTGNTRLTDNSPADVVAVLASASDVTARVSVSADAGPHRIQLTAQGSPERAMDDAPLHLTLQPRQSTLVRVTVIAESPLRRGSTALVVTAEIGEGAAAVDVSASQRLDVALSTDLLPGLLGVGSVIVIPGLVAIWAALSVLDRDRRRVGVESGAPSVSTRIWEEKALWLIAVVLSLLAAWVYSAFGFADLLDTYALSDVAWLAAVMGVLGGGCAALLVWWHRRSVPAVTSTSSELDVLRAACRGGARVSRRIYTVNGKIGLFVHMDRDAIVVTRPVEYTEMDALKDPLEKNDLARVVELIEATSDDQRQIRFSKDDRYVPGTRAVRNAVAVGEKQPLLEYRDALT